MVERLIALPSAISSLNSWVPILNITYVSYWRKIKRSPYNLKFYKNCSCKSWKVLESFVRLDFFISVSNESRWPTHIGGTC